MTSKKAQALKIEPAEVLSFKGPFTEVVTSTIILSNPTEDKVAFKVKTTAPKRYCVRPNSGILKQDESITVSVMLQPFEFDPAEKNKHKFMIQSLVMIGDIAESDVWKDVEAEKLMDTKLRVVFDVDTASSVTTSNAPAEQLASNQVKVSTPAAADNEPSSTTTTAADSKPTPSQQTTITSTSKKQITEEDYNKAKEDNLKLQDEVKSLREESVRLRKIAMSNTLSTGGKSTTTPQTPTGISLLFHDTNNLIILLILFIVCFGAGIVFSGKVF